MMSQEDKYKRFIETRGTEKPPEFIWEQISEQLDLDQIWMQVSRELDTDEVWNRIEQTLDQPLTGIQDTGTMHRLSPVIRWAAAAAVLLLLAGGAYYINKYAGNNIPGNMAQTGEPPAETLKKSPGDENISLSENKMEQSIPTRQDKESGSTGKQPDFAGQGLAETTEKTGLSERITKIAAVTGTGSGNTAELSLIGNPPVTTETSEDLPAKNPPVAGMEAMAPVQIQNSLSNGLPESSKTFVSSRTHVPSRRWYAGFSMHGENNWMLNPETYSGFRKNTLIATRPDFAAHVEFTGGYKIFPGWYLGTALFFSDRAGQSYQTYVDGHFTTKSVRLTYSGMNVHVKFSKTLFLRGMDYVHFNTYAGGYYHFLRGAVERLGSQQTDITSLYRKGDYGIVFGHELELNAGGGLYLVPGLKFKYGLPNIFNGDAILPAEINKTTTATIELSLGIHFIPGK